MAGAKKFSFPAGLICLPFTFLNTTVKISNGETSLGYVDVLPQMHKLKCSPTGLAVGESKDYLSDKITLLYWSLDFRKFTNTPTSIPETAR